MKILLRELRAHRKGLVFWSLGMFFLVVSGLAKFAALYTSGSSISTLISQLPKTMQVLFGLSGFNLSTASGYYGVLFLYLALMATTHAVLLGSEIVSKEERDKTAEFLLVRPIARSSVLTAKLFAGICNLIIINFVTLVSSLIALAYYNKGPSITQSVFVLMAGLFFLQLIFYCIGIAVAAIRTKPRASATISASILLGTFLLSYLIDFNDRFNALKYLTPYKYFDAKVLLTNNRLDPTYIVLSVLIIGVTIYFSYKIYSTRDIDC